MGETNEDLRKKLAAVEAKLAQETKARQTAELKLAEETKARQTAVGLGRICSDFFSDYFDFFGLK